MQLNGQKETNDVIKLFGLIPINFMLLKSIIVATITGCISLGSVMYKNFSSKSTTYTIKM